MLIDEFNELFETDLHMSDVDTMAGYLITALGMIPDEGETLSFDVDNITLITEEMEGSRVLKIRVKFHDPVETEVTPEEERRYFRKEFEEDEPRR
jgi:putative hemolysin